LVTSIIIGAKMREQLLDNIGVADVELSPEHIARLDAASALPSEYPGWMIDRQNADRQQQVEVKVEKKKVA
jgi:diketogulonate reductase-like aldo/keto reductase